MASAQGPQGDTETGTRRLLRQRVKEWSRLTDRIKEIRDWLGDPAGSPRPDDVDSIQEYEDRRKSEAEYIFDALKESPGLADAVDRWGFTHEGFHVSDYTGQGPTPDAAHGTDQSQPDRNRDQGNGTDTGGGGGSGSGGGGGKGGGGTKTGPPITHLPGKEGVDYHFVRGPNGQIKVIYDMDIPGPEKGSLAFTVPKELFDRYNVNPDKVKRLTAAQMKQLNGFGPINEIKLRRGEHPFQSWLRQMKQKFGSAPSMLRDKEVMQTLYAAHLGKWDSAQLKGALQQTKWYDTKRTERINWLFSTTTADKKTLVNTNFNQLSDYVRSVFGGVDWTKHGFDKNVLQTWAKNVASGKTGWDITEAKSRIDEVARNIEGTSLWANEEQASQSGLEEAQEWEDIFEKYRAQNIDWFGPSARSSREMITDWAKKRASGEVSDADYAQFLRSQRKGLYDYIPEDVSYRQFVDPYLSSLQRVMGDNASIDWTHPLLADLGAKDANGKPIGAPLSLYDFNLMARDPNRNPAAWQRGTQLWDEGQGLVRTLEGVMRGVS